MIKATENYTKAIDAVQEVGDLLQDHFGKAEPFRCKGNFSSDVVTRLDLEAEEILISRLKHYYPSIGFCGEEFGVYQDAERFWLVDPIDGTGHFVRGVPFCSTMVALVDKGEVVFSIIYDFVRENLYIAEKNKGAQLNGKPIHVSTRSLAGAYLSIESRLERPEHIAQYVALRHKTVLMTTVNCGYEFALIASGRIDGRVSLDPFGKDWDYAAGSLLVAEAGGIVANIGKQTYDFRDHCFLATNRVIYEELTGDAKALFAPSD